jgi:hypothetical protein
MGSFGVASSATVTTSSTHQQPTSNQTHVTISAITTHEEDDHNAGYGTEGENDSNTSVDDPGSEFETRHRIPDWETAFWRKYGNKIRVSTSGSLDLASEWVVEE